MSLLTFFFFLNLASTSLESHENVLFVKTMWKHISFYSVNAAKYVNFNWNLCITMLMRFAGSRRNRLNLPDITYSGLFIHLIFKHESGQGPFVTWMCEAFHTFSHIHKNTSTILPHCKIKWIMHQVAHMHNK